MLGDLLGMAQRSSVEFAGWLKHMHGDLAERCEAAARSEGQSLERWAMGSVSHFERFASADDWADLMSKVMASDEPGATCLLAMTTARLDHLDHHGSAAAAEQSTMEGTVS